MPQECVAGVNHACELMSAAQSPCWLLSAALLVQVTSYLMMGALSPGLKRHSVTLFEGETSAIAGACAVSSSKDGKLCIAASASPSSRFLACEGLQHARNQLLGTRMQRLPVCPSYPACPP